jgi:ABC-2 type transport system permease protein
MSTMLAGLGLGWFAFALAQSAIIVGVGALLFGVSWGDPVGAIALVTVFAFVGCGVGLLVGAIGKNEDRVAAITPPLGIVLGALGGCMVPLEVFPPVMRTIAHVTPHFWAIDSWQTLIFDGDGIGAILPALGVLLAFSAVFVVAASTLLRRNLTN